MGGWQGRGLRGAYWEVGRALVGGEGRGASRARGEGRGARGCKPGIGGAAGSVAWKGTRREGLHARQLGGGGGGANRRLQNYVTVTYL